MVSVCSALDRILGISHGYATGWFQSYEWPFRSQFGHLICHFTVINVALLSLGNCVRGWWQFKSSSEVNQWLPRALIIIFLSMKMNDMEI
jgi:hypothetical protein